MSTTNPLRRVILLASAYLCAAVLLGAQAPKSEKSSKSLRVLFVGNSYCSVNDLPALVAELGASDARAPKIEVESVMPGGATLKQHFEASGALDKIRMGKFTHVVLQGQSLEALAKPEDFLNYAAKLALEIEKSGAKTVFYQTWARREGAPEYAEIWSRGSPKSMQTALSAAYAKAAAPSGARVARVGDAWRKLLDEKGAPILFDADGSHPSMTGSYVAACVLYEAVSERSCLELEISSARVESKLASRLRKAAHAVAAK